MFGKFKGMRTIICSFFLFSLSIANQGRSSKVEIKDLITHADTYYWLGMEEKGDLQSFKRGLFYLNKADSLLASSKNNDSDFVRYTNQSMALRGDLDNQIVRASDRFIGTFPISNIIGYNFFTKNKAPGTFEMVDDPRVTSAINAIKNLVDDIAGKWGREPQIDVVFTSVPYDPELENEALYYFNQSSKYFVHNKREIRSVLNVDDMELFKQGEVSKKIKNKLIDAFNSSTLMMVLVRKLDNVDDVHFYLAEGHTYNKKSNESIRQFYTMGFSRDGRGKSNDMFLFIVVLFLVTFFIYNGLNYYRNQSSFSIKLSNLIIPLLYFAFGIIIPFLIQPVVSSFKPDVESFARISFWWPLIMGVTIFGGPNAVLFVASTRLGNIIPGLLTGSRGGSTALTITAGSSCYFSVPLVLFNHPITSIFSILMIIAVLFSGYLFGKAIDKVEKTPVEYLLIPLFIFAGVGLGIYTLNLKIMFLMTLISVISTWFENKEVPKIGVDKKTDKIDEGNSLDLSIDSGKFAFPDYLPLSYYNDDISLWVDNFKKERKYPVLTLFGNSGVGKTATANYITKELMSTYGDKIVVLKGQCSEALNENTEIFKPFKEALQSYFHINLLGTDDQKMEQIEGAMGAVFNSVLPIAGVFLPPVTSEESKAGTKADIFHAVWKMLEDRSKSKVVLIFIDDFQWIDTDSLELLNYLLKKIENKNVTGESGLAFILTGRSEEDIPKIPDGTKIKIPKKKVQLNGPNDEERIEILSEKLNFKKSAAEAIVAKAKAGTALNGGMFWVIQIIIQLAQDKLLKDTSNGFDLTIKPDSIPIPSNMQEALEAQLDQFPGFISIFECAACLGRQFTATVLSESLGISRLETLSMLKDIEQKSGIIKDIKEADDKFEFHSSFMLETIRNRLSINGKGPSSPDVPQIIREYHQRASRSLQKQYDNGRSDIVFELADHYYAAGALFVEKTYTISISAAFASLGSYNYKQAFIYLNRARECGKLCGRYKHWNITNENSKKKNQNTNWIGKFLNRGTWSNEEILIACNYAHTTGMEETYIANLAEQFYENLPENEPKESRLKILMATTLALYDAQKFESSQKYAEVLIDISYTPMQKAAGLQLKGLSLSPKENRANRVSALEEAFKIILDIENRSMSEERFHGRILDSLGREYTAVEGKKEKGLELLEKRIELNKKKNLGDMLGMAMTYGSIGRYYLYNTLNVGKARESFKSDFDITIELNDIEGQSQMFSLLGECDVKENKNKEALVNFENAFQCAQKMDDSGFINKLFPCTSAINLCVHMQDDSKAEVFGLRLFQTLQQFQSRLKPQDYIVANIDKNIVLWKKKLNSEWISGIKNILDEIKKYKKKD
jgi:hypothetical protein